MSASEVLLAPDSSNSQLWRPVEGCMVCGGHRFPEKLQASDPHYGNAGLFVIAECEECGLQFLNPQPTQLYLNTAYPADYYSYHCDSVKFEYRSLLWKVKDVVLYAMFRLFGRRDARFERPGSILDIGCGAGDFLVEMRERGWRVQGVELSAVAAEAGRSYGGLEIFGGFLKDAHFPDSSFDYVRLNHAFEHVENPRDLLREISRIIKPSGTLFIGVPNVASLPARMFGRYWFNLGPPVHPYGYSPRTLTQIVEQEGFLVDKLRYHSFASGLTGSLQIYFNRRSGHPSHTGRIINSRLLKLLGRFFMAVLDMLGQGDCIELIARPKARP